MKCFLGISYYKKQVFVIVQNNYYNVGVEKKWQSLLLCIYFFMGRTMMTTSAPESDISDSETESGNVQANNGWSPRRGIL